MSAQTEPPRPPGWERVRRAAIAAMVLTGAVGFVAAQETVSLSALEQVAEVNSELADAKMMEQMLKARAAAVEAMHSSRGLILTALAMTCALTFAAALRVLRPGLVPRERARQMLVGSAIAAAVFRTIDGAQLTVIAQRMGAAAEKVLADPTGAQAGVLTVASAAAAVVQTALIAGAFMGLALFFRSERVKQLLVD